VGAGQVPSATLRAAYFSAWHNVVESPDGTERMKRIWEGREPSPVPLAEADRIRLAATLAVLEVEGWRQVLEQEASAITNPDRGSRFAFLRPALSADPTDRERFFSALADPSNRQHEPWVLDGLSYLNHPLRADHARQFIEPALELLEEVQRTGDIFFPGAWIRATLSGHTQPEAAETVRAFLDARTDYPAPLRGKILQASDMLERSASILYGWSG
jgi:aminopeptidase N